MMNGYESKREEKELDGIFCVKEQFFNDGILKITRYSVQNGDSKIYCILQERLIAKL